MFDFWLNEVLRPFLRHRRRIAMVFLSLFMMALSTALIIVSLGPLVKLLFAAEPGQSVQITELVPTHFVGVLDHYFPTEIAARSLGLIIPILIFAAGVLKAIATYFYTLNQQSISLAVSMRLRVELFARLIGLPFLKLQAIEPGQAMALLMNDVAIIQSKFSDFITNCLRDGMIVLVAIATMLLVNYRAALILLLIAPVIAALLGSGGIRITKFADQWQSQLRGLAAMLFDVRQRFDFMRAQAGEDWEMRRFVRVNDHYLRSIRRSLALRSVYAPSVEFAGTLGFAAFCWWFFRVKPEPHLVEQSVQFLAAFGLMVKPLKTLGEQYVNFSEAQGSLKKAIELYQQVPLAGTKATTRPRGNAVNGIEELQVTYASGPTIRVSNLHFKAGTMVGIVGPSGAGKSSIAKCLAGLIPPTTWQAGADWGTVVEQVSYVSQHPFLFDETIRENLVYGSQIGSISDERIWWALEIVDLTEVVRLLPEQLATNVAKFQGNFSGGQIQRLVLARALLRPDKPILVLDEATSSLDVETEGRLLSNFRTHILSQGRAIIMVTHRQNRFHEFDELIFVESGSVWLRGKHVDLMKEPRYAEFCRPDRD